MKFSYEIGFRTWLALIAAAGILVSLISLPAGVCTFTALLILSLLASAQYAWWLPRISKHLPIFLMLHSVSDEIVDPICPNNSVRPKELTDLIRNLLASGYTFQTAIDAIRNPRNRSVVLTFDDGLIDNYTILFPILKAFNVPATLFITNRGDTDPERFLSRDRVREMAASGLIEFGGHTADHTVLDSVPADVAAESIRQNFAWLTEVLGTPPLCFAYPCGGYTPEVIEALKSTGYAYAFTMHKKMRPVSANPYLIHRQIIPRGKPPLATYLIATRGRTRI